MEEIKVVDQRLSEKYIFLSKIQMTLDNATNVCKQVETENIRIQEKNKADEKRRENNVGRYYEEECPVCYESFSGLCKVVPLCGHEICIGCYLSLRTNHCVKCRQFYK